jgi:hypothetical protein
MDEAHSLELAGAAARSKMRGAAHRVDKASFYNILN